MRKKFGKFVALILAFSMMSMTVFAAEDTLGSDANTSPEVTEPSADQNTESSTPTQTASEEGSQPGSDQQPQQESSEGEQKSEQASSETEQKSEETAPETEKKSEDAAPESEQKSEQKDPEETEKEASSTSENADAEKNKTSENNAEQKEEVPAAVEPASETSDNEETSDDDEGERRSAQIQSENWSNGAIEDVMGVRAVSDGQTVTISYKTKHTNQWDGTYSQYPLIITYPDGTTQEIKIDYSKGIHGDYYSDIPGYSVTESSDQADTLTLNISIPASYFRGTDFTVSSQQYTATVQGEVIEEPSTSDPDAVYDGIGLDGDFSDWNAVTKYDLKEPEGDHNVESVGWVIDSDRGYVYIYIKDSGNNSATWAGPNHNGKFEILTDLGNRMLIQLTQDGAVVAANGYDAVHQGSQWEIAIPISELPTGNGGLSFGLYMGESSLSGYGNVGEVGSPTGITYDGSADDWKYYPTTLIQYATPGTQEIVVDGEAKQYNDQNENIYGYCKTSMPSHLSERGGEYSAAVKIAVNNDWSGNALEMRLVTVDENGNINWNPQRSGLLNGSYEYYIFATSCWGSSKNINELLPADVCYGKTTINITDTQQEMEWYVNTVKLAERYGIDPSDVKIVSTKYGRIGQQEVTCAGTSSGPWGGATMCMLCAAAPFVIKKKFVF